MFVCIRPFLALLIVLVLTQTGQADIPLADRRRQDAAKAVVRVLNKFSHKFKLETPIDLVSVVDSSSAYQPSQEEQKAQQDVWVWRKLTPNSPAIAQLEERADLLRGRDGVIVYGLQLQVKAAQTPYLMQAEVVGPPPDPKGWRLLSAFETRVLNRYDSATFERTEFPAAGFYLGQTPTFFIQKAASAHHIPADKGFMYRFVDAAGRILLETPPELLVESDYNTVKKHIACVVNYAHENNTWSKRMSQLPTQESHEASYKMVLRGETESALCGTMICSYWWRDCDEKMKLVKEYSRMANIIDETGSTPGSTPVIHLNSSSEAVLLAATVAVSTINLQRKEQQLQLRSELESTHRTLTAEAFFPNQLVLDHVISATAKDLPLTSEEDIEPSRLIYLEMRVEESNPIRPVRVHATVQIPAVQYVVRSLIKKPLQPSEPAVSQATQVIAEPSVPRFTSESTWRSNVKHLEDESVSKSVSVDCRVADC
eukprot:GILK01009724.1.p1 GENE.GILK01009724.1~~GILK01009724.1.p1  ORF type:complete len:484 (-),score=103.13 GILK01009724.1:64-1515(-)